MSQAARRGGAVAEAARLSTDFRPEALTPGARRIVRQWGRISPIPDLIVPLIYGSMRLSIGRFRGLGWDERRIRDELLGGAQDHASACRMPARGRDILGRDAFLRVVREVFDVAWKAERAGGPDLARRPEEGPR